MGLANAGQPLGAALAGPIVGIIGLNDVPSHPPEVPFGGWKESGYGTEGSIEILAPYQKTKFVNSR